MLHGGERGKRGGGKVSWNKRRQTVGIGGGKTCWAFTYWVLLTWWLEGTVMIALGTD